MVSEEALEGFVDVLMEFDGSEGNYLRGAQREAFSSLTEGLMDGETEGFVKLPPGEGKTAFSISLIENFLRSKKERGERSKIIIIVPFKDHVEQVAREFAKFTPELAPLSSKAGDEIEDGKTVLREDSENSEICWAEAVIGQHYTHAKHGDREVIITTYTSAKLDAEKPEEEQLFSHPDMVVYDEGQWLTAYKASQLIDFFKGAIQIAVTATPTYSEDKSLHLLLPYEYYGLSMLEAMERGDLCPMDCVVVNSGLGINLDKVGVVRTEHGADFNQKQLEEVLDVDRLSLLVADLYMNYVNPRTKERLFGKLGIVNFESVKQAEEAARNINRIINSHSEYRRYLEKRGIATIAAAITNDTPIHERRDIYKARRQGKILILTGVQILGVGHNEPNNQFVMNMTPTLSPVKAEQRGGRAARLDPDNPGKIGTVIDVMHSRGSLLTEEKMSERLSQCIVFSEILRGDHPSGKAIAKPCKKREAAEEEGLPGIIITEPHYTELLADLASVERFAGLQRERRALAEAKLPSVLEFENHVSARALLNEVELPKGVLPKDFYRVAGQWLEEHEGDVGDLDEAVVVKCKQGVFGIHKVKYGEIIERALRERGKEQPHILDLPNHVSLKRLLGEIELPPGVTPNAFRKATNRWLEEHEGDVGNHEAVAVRCTSGRKNKRTIGIHVGRYKEIVEKIVEGEILPRIEELENHVPVTRFLRGGRLPKGVDRIAFHEAAKQWAAEHQGVDPSEAVAVWCVSGDNRVKTLGIHERGYAELVDRVMEEEEGREYLRRHVSVRALLQEVSLPRGVNGKSFYQAAGRWLGEHEGEATNPDEALVIRLGKKTLGIHRGRYMELVDAVVEEGKRKKLSGTGGKQTLLPKGEPEEACYLSQENFREEADIGLV